MTSLKSKYNYEKKYVKFKDFEKVLNPLDLILFNSVDYIDKCTKCLRKKKKKSINKWVHVGLICPQNFMKFEKKFNKDSYIIESIHGIHSNINSIDTNRLKNGLQIRKLKDVVDLHIKKGGIVVGIKLLNNPFNLTLMEEKNLSYKQKQIYINSRLSEKFRLNNFWNTYTNNKFSLFKNIKKYKRSEVVTKLYQCLDIVNNSIKPDKINPGEIAKSCVNNNDEIIFDNSNINVLIHNKTT